MSAARPVDALLRALARVRWSVLATLGVSAAVILARGAWAAPRAPGSAASATLMALGLAFASIVARQIGARPQLPLRGRVRWLTASLVLAGSLGLVGAGVTLATGDARTGLLFCLGGAIFSLRPLPALGPARGR